MNLYAVFLTENIPTKNAWVSVKKICYLEDAPLETQRLLWALWFMQVGFTTVSSELSYKLILSIHSKCGLQKQKGTFVLINLIIGLCFSKWITKAN